MKRIMKSGEEYDVYTKWRKVLIWTKRPGAIKRVKRRTHKRERRESKRWINEYLSDETASDEEGSDE